VSLPRQIFDSIDRFRRRVSEPVEKVLIERLEREIHQHPCPRSIGIIMDGNRRWASLHGEKPWFGHRLGKEKVRDLLDWCKRFRIRGVVLYAFSVENFSRPRSEIDEIMKLMKQGFDELASDPLISREGIRVRVIGRKNLLPEEVQQSIRTVEDISRDNDAYDLTFAIAYGGRDEIIDACRSIAAKVRSGMLEPSAIDEETVSNHLYAAIDDPDLIIRTSGEQRLSNFLPWQSVYSELHFTSTFWPAFRYIDFLRSLRAYQRRDRRIGR
jgi:tritrans,polycis-undecaprenyl-diphosphate synthase [geranylgeranyl-diphosphate specific]